MKNTILKFSISIFFVLCLNIVVLWFIYLYPIDSERFEDYLMPKTFPLEFRQSIWKNDLFIKIDEKKYYTFSYESLMEYYVHLAYMIHMYDWHKVYFYNRNGEKIYYMDFINFRDLRQWEYCDYWKEIIPSLAFFPKYLKNMDGTKANITFEQFSKEIQKKDI